MPNRDPRLRFASDAYTSFWHEDIGFMKTLARCQPLSSAAQIAIRMFLKLKGVDASSTINDRIYRGASIQAPTLIVDSAIYDIPDVFSTTIDPSIDLASPTKIIRVIRIYPGTGESSIRCKLEKLDLNDGGTYDALSYVSGKDDKEILIWVDDQPFLITPHLYEILTTLRSLNTDKVIWIDAICINQTDDDGRTHQVGLVRQIYSQVKSTIIWLGGQTADDEPKSFQESSLFDNPHNVL
ncbi:heterokaryon incompatibility protein-domain-containing protein [Xylaria acuta]|nr:heterokaryon incompatibility protein-domain-containing protein [Xylaria acuta]